MAAHRVCASCCMHARHQRRNTAEPKRHQASRTSGGCEQQQASVVQFVAAKRRLVPVTDTCSHIMRVLSCCRVAAWVHDEDHAPLQTHCFTLGNHGQRCCCFYNMIHTILHKTLARVCVSTCVVVVVVVWSQHGGADDGGWGLNVAYVHVHTGMYTTQAQRTWFGRLTA